MYQQFYRFFYSNGDNNLYVPFYPHGYSDLDSHNLFHRDVFIDINRLLGHIDPHGVPQPDPDQHSHFGKRHH